MWLCPGMARSPIFPARPVPMANTRADIISRTASWECPVVPKGIHSPWDSPGTLWAQPRESCPFPTHLLGIHQPFWQLPGSSPTSRAVGEPSPGPAPLNTHGAHRAPSCSTAAAQQCGDGSMPTEGSQELPNQSLLPLLGFTCS